MASRLEKSRAFQLLQEEWEERGTSGINDYLALKHFILKWMDEKPELNLPYELLRSQFVATLSQVCSKEDIKKGRVAFRVNERSEYLRFHRVGKVVMEARETFCGVLKQSAIGQFSYKELCNEFMIAKLAYPSVNLLQMTLHLVKCSFLLISFLPTDTSDEENPKRTDNQIRSAARVEDNALKQQGQNLMSVETRKRLAEDKNGITVSLAADDFMEAESDKEEGIVDFRSQNVGERRSVTLNITYHNDGKMKITTCKLLDNCDVFCVEDDLEIAAGERVGLFKKNSCYKIKITYISKGVGTHKTPLVLQFQNENGEHYFEIWRFLSGQTKNEEMDEIKPTAPYKAFDPRETARDPSSEIIPGVPPEGLSNGTIEVPLDDCKVPRELQSTTKHVRIPESWNEILEQDLTLQNHKAKFDALLYIEELQMEVDIRRYDMKDAEMTKESNDHLGLKVPGLAENRPSLIPGDRVYVQETKNGKPVEHREYEGFIHFIEEEKILLKFKNSFHGSFIKGKRYHVRFSFNRLPLKLQHRALKLAHELVEAGRFPYLDIDTKNASRDFTDLNLSLHDIKIEKNEEQYTAVKNIVSGTSKPFPYIIFGPPGTGKTVTTVEAMKQVLKLQPTSRILACAPSNSAADLMLERFLDSCPIMVTEVFRLNAFSRAIKSLPEKLKKHCKIVKRGWKEGFDIPSCAEVMNYRLVVCTMTTAGRLVSMGVPRNHFSHVFMDECGQALEPEALIPLAGLLDGGNDGGHANGGQLVLAGDPKQLGPVLRSSLVIKYGFQMSLLERLMQKASRYQRNDGKFNQHYITKLVNNYRSHEAILKVPNKLFYDDELQPKADEIKRASLCQWDELPKKGFPMIFDGVQGNDCREESSPSFFNAEEATIVMGYIRKLLDERRFGVVPSQIGIISPYRKQVAKIRQLFQKGKKIHPNFSDIKVGSVEEFQGQERRIIIITTVRSNQDFLKMDSEFRLGFLRNPKRFNVAVTRPQALLIVVGNPFVLSVDPHWKEFLDFCREKGGYKGCRYSEDEVAKMTEKMNQLSLMPSNDLTFDDDTPWQRKDE